MILTTEGTPAPFDITDQRYIAYDLSSPASIYLSQERLLESARYALAHPEQLHTPVSEYAKTVDRTSRAAGGDQSALIEMIQGLQEQVGAIDGTVRWMRLDQRASRTVLRPTLGGQDQSDAAASLRRQNAMTLDQADLESDPFAHERYIKNGRTLAEHNRDAEIRAQSERERAYLADNPQGDENDV